MYSYEPTNRQPQNSQYSQYPQNGSAWYAPMPASGIQPAKVRKGGRSGGGNGGRNSGRPGKRKSFKWAFVKFLLVLVLLAGLGVGGYVFKVQSDVRPYLNVFLDNISVDGINLSGMTWKEGSDAVWAQANAKQSSWYVRLKSTSGEYKDITAETLGIKFDPSRALEEAWAIGHETSTVNRKTIFQLQEEIAYMKTSSKEFSSGLPQGANTAPIDDILQTLENNAFTSPEDAKILSFNPDDRQNPFTFQNERVGKQLDTTAAKEQILEMVRTFQSGEVLLQTEAIAPEVTVADLQKTVSLRFRARTPIDKSSSEERTNNIRVAFSKINGLRITNGSKFSFNKVVGVRTKKNGFHEALEIAYGEYVLGVGGGVCQASTTVYLAAVQSGMSIEKREQHSNPVSYTDKGKDATVSDTKGREIDFVFKNTSGGDIFLTAHVISDPANKNRLLSEVCIYGPSLDGVSYELEAVTVEILPKPTEDEAQIVEDTEAKHATYMDERVTVTKASEGSVVETYLNTFVNGQRIDRVLLYTDTYKSRRPVIYVGVTPRF